LTGAETHFKEAVRLQPTLAQAFTGLAQVCARLERYADAIDAYRRALTINHNDGITLGGFAACLVRIGHLGEAREVYQYLIALAPNKPKLTIEYANALQATGNLDDALPVYRRILACEPHLVEGWVNLGHVLREKGHVGAAMDAYERAIADGLSHDKGALYLGLALGNGEFFNSMLMYLDHAPVEGTDAERAAVMRSIALLTTGRLAEGWPQYDERLFTAKTKIERRPEPPRYWKGESLVGKTVYAWPEQGIGDQIIYGTLLPDLAARGGKVYFESEPRLERVFRRSLPETVVLSKGSDDAKAAVTTMDYQIPLGSLGLYFRRSLEDFPRHTAYLKADLEKAAAIRARYEQRASGRRIIGLSWKSKRPRGGEGKSIKLMEWEPLLRTPGVLFINLQYGDCAAELAEVKANLGIEVFVDPDVDPMGEMDDFFAQVAALDLVISTSNTTVHVAGSINAPCWVILPRGGGSLWYWFTEREDSPWYSSLRLFRPENIGPGWGQELMPRLSRELMHWLEQDRYETGHR
jgi:tetratricopeptide (TPR) repeat protein